jgi:hypothetical protein
MRPLKVWQSLYPKKKNLFEVVKKKSKKNLGAFFFGS